jgi:hypothetical protein
MAAKGANSPFNICYVETPTSVTAADGTVTAGPNIKYYFQSSRMYGQTEVAKRTGITLIDADKWEGQEPLVKIEQLILSRKLVALIGEIDRGTNGIANARVLCARSKAADILSDDKTKNLDTLDYLNNKGVANGKFFNVRSGTRNRFT